MNERVRPATFALVAALALAVATHATRPASGAPVPLPSATAFGDTPPPLSATATPRPEGTLLRYAGQLLDYQRGFVFFTTGDGYRADAHLKIDDAKTGGATALVARTRTYAVATFDAATGTVVELGLSSKPLEPEATYDAVRKFAVALSTPYPNPDLRPGGHGFNGKPVLVGFSVEVPSETKFDAAVYLATDVSGWSATAIRMDRVDVLHYRVSRYFASGTKLYYRYTLGSWQSAERGQNGLEVTPRLLLVQNGDVRSEKDVVYSWGTTNQFDPQNDQPLPTPFNPIPFNTPPHH